MSGSNPSGSGLWDSVRRVLDSILGAVQHRVELFGVELREERRRMIEAALCAAALVVMSMMALALVTFAIVIAFWETARMPVLLVLSAAYVAGAVYAWRRLQEKLDSPGAFASTVEQIKKDRACLDQEN